MIKNKNVAFCIFVVVFIVLWNLLDFLYAALITKSGYQFSGITDLGMPLGAAIVLGYLFILRHEDA